MTLDENDFLTFQLYTASKTPRIKRQRIRGWILSAVLFLCLSYLFYQSDNDFLGIYFLIITCLSIVFYPFYTRWRYKRHYRRYIQDTYKNRFGENCTIEFDDKAIITRDSSGESRINKSELEEINEIRDYYFIKTKSGVSLIISKAKTENIDLVKNEIALLVSSGVKINVELDWKWK